MVATQGALKAFRPVLNRVMLTVAFLDPTPVTANPKTLRDSVSSPRAKLGPRTPTEMESHTCLDDTVLTNASRSMRNIPTNEIGNERQDIAG